MTGDTRLLIQTKIYQEVDGIPDVMEFSASARTFEKETGCFILYEQVDEETGMKTQNRLKITDAALEITGKGAVESKMELRIGQTTKADYRTPYGRLMMDVKTSFLRLLTEPNRIVVEAEYELWAEDSFVSKNCLFLKTVSS